MLLLIGALTIGLILSLLALGAFISFRVFDFPDITMEGSITLGAAMAATLLVGGVHPLAATAAAFACGAGRASSRAWCTRASASAACSPASW
jgi:putative ABC transport system permease protein